MSIRRILVPLSGGDVDHRVLALAFMVAREQHAHVDALFVRPDPSEALPYLGEGVSGAVVEDILRSAKAAASEAAADAKRSLEAAAKQAQVAIGPHPGGPGTASARFLEQTGRVADVVAHAARLADLVVASDASEASAPNALTTVEAALINVGRPVLIASASRAVTSVGQTVVIAWNDSTEAAHAVSAALGFLHGARKIQLVTVNTGSATRGNGADVADYLAIHGFSTEEHVIEPAGRMVGQALLDFATESGADLLVMGGYGHSRLREFIFGGATRLVLTDAKVPILLAH